MPSTHPPLKLSRDEERFLRHWIYDEAHYRDGAGPAKRLQVEHGVVPADLASLAAAAMPDPEDQAAAADVPPAGPPFWPWTRDALRARLAEARAALGPGR
jgi:hypothetical protein